MAAILSGLWAKSSITVTPFAVPTTSNRRRMPLNVAQIGRSLREADTADLRDTQCGKRVGDVVQARNSERHRDASRRSRAPSP